jgi:hypothetical protein
VVEVKFVLQHQQHSTQGLTRLYIIALSAIAICAIIGQVVIQSSLYQQSSDARKINYAGRQRFLSLKLTMSVSGLIIPSDPLDKNFRINEVRATLQTLEHEHHALIYGDASLGLPGDNSDAVMQLFNSVEWKFQAIQSAATQMLARIDHDHALDIKTPSSALVPYVDTVLEQEEGFVATMDKTVAQYQHEAEDRVLRLRITEIVLCSLTLAILLLEGLFVFHPAISRLQKSLAALFQAEKQVMAQFEELEQKNNDLELAFEEAMVAHRKVMPHARIVALGHYQVQGSQGNYHEVESQVIDGTMVLTCRCPMYRRNRICSHSLAAASLHSALLRQAHNFPQYTTNFSSSDVKREMKG